MTLQPKNKNYYGTILSGNAKSHYCVQFDEFPHDLQEVKLVRRKIMKPVAPDEEEIEFDKVPQDASDPLANEAEEAASEEKKSANKSITDFCSLPTATLADCKVFDFQYGKEDDEFIKWNVMGDTEYIGEDEELLKVPDRAEFKNPNLFEKSKDPDFDFNKVFFDDFFPSIKGHAKIIDDFHSNSLSPYFATCKADNIAFHDPKFDDPDHLVRVCFTLLIAAATEVHHGVENLWKRGKSNGRHDYPDFGKYIPKNYFKAFLAAAPYCWCDKKFWYQNKDERMWDIFLPCIQQYNGKRRLLLKVVLLLLDESMSGWRPKTSKLGGLPNYTYEPRKPIPLGTMFRNGAECMVGSLVYQDVVQLPEQQHRKKYHGEKSSLPGKDQLIGAPTAEVLRQVDGAEVVKGGWVGGDAWFGSVMTCVEVMKRLGVHSTFIIKNNHSMYPMQALMGVLKARFGKRPAGHWVTFRTEIGGVKLFAIAYAWSQRGVSYFLSTCGRTDPHAQKYRSNFEDNFGVVTFKELSRPHIAHFLYDYLPLIDEHNKQRQSILNLERCWLTNDCWMRLVTTIVGMSVVDFQRCVKNSFYHHHMETDLCEDDLQDEEDMKVRHFSDKICKWLDQEELRNRASPRKNRKRGAPVAEDSSCLLERIVDETGNSTRQASARQANHHGRITGNSVVRNCFVCRMYLKEDGQTLYTNTSFWCKMCHMPICKKESWSEVDGRRTSTCLETHRNSEGDDLRCHGVVSGKPFAMPKMMQIEYPRRSARKSG